MNEPMREDEYIKLLTLGDRKKYYKIKSKCIGDKSREWKEILKDKKEREIYQGMNVQLNHDRILNMCISPFIHDKKIANLGYEFKRCEPLSEFVPVEDEIKNTDFLVFNYRNFIGIFFEVKGLVENANKIVMEMEEKRKKVNDHLDYIKKEYLRTSRIDTLEYVIGIPAHYANDILEIVRERKSRLIVWGIHTIPFSNKEKKTDESEKKEAIKIRIIDSGNESDNMKEEIAHKDKHLRNLLKKHGGGLKTSGASEFDIFPSSPTLWYLKYFNNIAYNIEGKRIIDIEEVKRKLHNYDLRYLCSEKERDNLNNAFITKKIGIAIEKGKVMDFLRETEKSNHYEIVTNHTIAKDVEGNNLIPKYLESKLEQKKKQYLEKMENEDCYEFTKKEFFEKVMKFQKSLKL